MKNNREYRRYAVKCNGNITDSNYHDFSFFMNDISAGGMSITTDGEIKDEQALSIQFDILEVLLPRKLQLKGVVVHKKAHKSVHQYGIRFFNLTTMEIVEIDEYLRFRHYSSLVHMVDNPTEDADTRLSAIYR